MKSAPTEEVVSLSAEEALDFAGSGYLVLVAFADAADFKHSWRAAARKCSLLGFKTVRVEPTEENGINLQISCHPRYTLFRQGNEDWSELGNERFLEKIEALRP